ncbi:MAG TPA: hypothetical protein VJ808_08000 [Gemmatimonadales bacterium]|nr:hypothetical protein [Gemmatimonadales bacterium]
MLVCQWHLDIVYGKQAEAVRIMREWGADKFASSEFRLARGARLLVGFIGESASHVVDEYYFASLADFETALGSMAAPRFRAHSEALAPYIVPGSQHWVVYRVLSEP